MRIAINAVTLLYDHLGHFTFGVGTYTRNLIRALAQIDKTNEYSLYYGYMRAQDLPAPPGPNFHNVKSWVPGRIRKFLVEQCRWPIERWIGPADVVHDPFGIIPHTRNARRVMMLYDVMPLRFPDEFRHILRQGWERKARTAANEADCVITVSESSRSDIVNFLGVPASRTRVTLLAPDPAFLALDKATAHAAVAARYGLEGRIILHIGGFEPHNNTGRLLQAFRRALPRLRGNDRLVLTGPKEGLPYSGFVESVRALNLEGSVRTLGHLPLTELVDLVNAACVVVIPSLWEGFGLPVIEAMACGTPVITSNVGATREIAGDAALLIDPEETEMLSEALLSIANDPDLAGRLRHSGLTQAQRFSWLRTARDTREVYEGLARVSSSPDLR